MRTYISIQLELDSENYDAELKAVLSDLKKQLVKYDANKGEYVGKVVSRWHTAGTVHIEDRAF